jgi:hypothetical protein
MFLVNYGGIYISSLQKEQKRLNKRLDEASKEFGQLVAWLIGRKSDTSLHAGPSELDEESKKERTRKESAVRISSGGVGPSRRMLQQIVLGENGPIDTTSLHCLALSIFGSKWSTTRSTLRFVSRNSVWRIGEPCKARNV